MNIKRVRRISSEIKKVISNCILNSIKDPRIDKLNVSITEVKVTNDLSFATIYVDVIGDDDKKEKTLEGLNKAKGYIKKEIGDSIDLRHVPQLIFKLDNTSEQGMHIENLIKVIHDESKNGR
ncbi:30S ribosome-binding factor RbfA [uncultured Finegoldia sp.]|uniref:30S ribosome-binding factor RbfA n=1 Tax=uncultured Finegoldia sp. TaxID=328009 RepID=UPI002607AF45|nr:30S ribosome-binding factor RbfA [uncultured Finegoldia sp.]